MSGFLFVFIASLFASASSVITAKSIRIQKSSSGYFTFYYLISLFCVCLTNFFSFPKINFNLPLSLVGALAGVLLLTSMCVVGKGVQKGPSGLTFAFLNSGAIAPPILMAFVFSAPFGFTLNYSNLIGMSLVLGGLFWGACGGNLSISSKKWFLYAMLAFAIQGLILSIFQWHALLIQEGLPQHRCVPFHCEASEDFWFMPFMFVSACLLQGLYFFFSQRRAPSYVEILGGSLGGIANGLSTFFLLLATSYASDHEKSMLFPLFAAFVILLCSCLERFINKEKVNWIALGLLASGIFVGTFF